MGAALPDHAGDEVFKSPMVIGTEFPEGGWDPLLRAAVVATDFAVRAATTPAKLTTLPADDPDATKISEKVTSWNAWSDMRVLLNAKLSNTPENLAAELQHLRDLRAKERGAGYQAAIFAQAGDFTTYYADLLACSPASRPATWSLVLIGLQVGGMVSARFKSEFMRPRPAQVWPGIAPMIDTPPHPAYPSGHALQAYLIEACVVEAVPAMFGALRGLSEEIPVNRERAGVHWPSDKEGSWAIKDTIMGVLREVPAFKEVVERAKTEWAPVKPKNRGQRAIDGELAEVLLDLRNKAFVVPAAAPAAPVAAAPVPVAVNSEDDPDFPAHPVVSAGGSWPKRAPAGRDRVKFEGGTSAPLSREGRARGKKSR